MIKEYNPPIKRVLKIMKYIIIFELIFFTGFVGYEFINWKRKMDTLKSLTGELLEKSELFTSLGNMEKEIEKIQSEIKSEEEVFFDRESFEIFINSLEEKVNSTGLSLKSIYIGEKTKISDSENKHFRTPVNLQIYGNINKIIDFMSFLENYSHLIIVKSLSVVVNPSEKTFLYSLQLSIDMPLYESTNAPSL